MKDIVIEDFSIDKENTEISGPDFRVGKLGEFEVEVKDLRVDLELNVSKEGLEAIKRAVKDIKADE